jgi:hypothetical protein
MGSERDDGGAKKRLCKCNDGRPKKEMVGKELKHEE